MSRFIFPSDVWECPKCRQFYLVGKRCTKCDTSYADVLSERNKKQTKERRKPFVPEAVSESGILESFMKRRGN